MKRRNTSVAVIGLGYWGRNLVRIAVRLGYTVYGVDRSTQATKKILPLFPSVRILPSVNAVCANPELTDVIIATPSETHFDIARLALTAGKNVLVEKPLCQNIADARALARISRTTRCRLMTDHTFLYSGALARIWREFRTGNGGKLRSVVSQRIGGIPRKNSSVLWDLGIHDASIGLHLFGSLPTGVRILDTDERNTWIRFIMQFDSKGTYEATVAWTPDIRLRTLSAIGTRASYILSWNGSSEICWKYDQYKLLRLKYTAEEPLETMVKTFLGYSGNTARNIPHNDGVRAVRIISALHTSLKRGGSYIRIDRDMDIIL